MSTTAAPLPVQLSRLIMSAWVPQAIHVAAALGLADRLAGGPATSDDVARAVGAKPDAVRRILRALAVLDLVRETEGGAFALAPMGEYLRSDAPDSMRSWALLWGSERIWNGWGKLLPAVKTGETAPKLVAGKNAFEWMAEDPALLEIFDRSMTELTKRHVRAIVAAYDFSGASKIVDVGGGNGALLAGVLASAPRATGIVLDLPHGRERALRLLADSGVAGRCEFVGGSFFDSVPAGADLYVVKSVLHDWDDERCLAILRRCRDAMPGAARLLVVEVLAPERPTGSLLDAVIAGSDLNMLLMAGGRERTEAEYRRLLESAGFDVTRVVATPSMLSAVEAKPAAR
jgi:O-methyltransferase/methyltransferase family protein